MKSCVSVYNFYPAYRRKEIRFMDIMPKARQIKGVAIMAPYCMHMHAKD
ncbi:MAG: hypothetical protein SCM11_14160 [Bacillota bacterium]|nr:hypothetical protein [Bacillota bacterium]